MISEQIADAGFAIGWVNCLTGAYHFRHREERFDLQTMRLDGVNKFVRTWHARQLGFEFPCMLARIEEIRQCAKIEGVTCR